MKKEKGYESIVLDKSVLDIDSWLPEKVIKEIAQILKEEKKQKRG